MDEKEAFLVELRILLHKHKVEIVDYDEYNSEEEYCGTTYCLRGTNSGSLIHVYISELKEILDEDNIRA